VDWNWEQAEDAFQHALSLNPNYSTAHKYYAEHLSITGQHELARKHMNRALELDPLSFVVRYTSAQFYYHQGHFEEGLKELDICDEIEEGHPWTPRYRFRCNWQLGRDSIAYDSFRKLIGSTPAYDIHTADSIFRRSGLKAVMEWQAEIEIKQAEAEETGLYTFRNLANDLAMLGRDEEALYWLERAFQTHSNSSWTSFNIHFKKLHDNPRFQAILEGMGLGNYL
jgi:tetratricopeptide (TPR) repeat protein